MTPRQAKEEDIPAIVDLLKLSLGESLTPKTISFWKWKHLENPFGKSPVLLLEENGKIVGVRAFLQWRYLINGENMLAGRAVDTAIHPSYQGKGLFTKLTKKLLDQVEQDGFQFIFNSPNNQSLPGYLKMGWERWGKLPLKIQLNPFPKKNKGLSKPDWRLLDPLIENIENSQGLESEIQTKLEKGFINWRYEHCPIVDYFWISDQSTYLMIFRLKKSRVGTEFRIVEFYKTPEFSEFGIEQVNQRLKNKITETGANFISFSGLQFPNSHLKLGILPIINQGPLVTLRNLNSKASPLDLPWSWSLGDLELF